MGPTNAQIFETWQHNLTNHKPTDEGIKLIEDNRDGTIKLAGTFIENCPEGRERSLALTHLETALFYANAAVARNHTEDK